MEQKSPYEALQHEVCVALGFCGSVVDGKPSHVDFFIPEQGPVSADEFVEWVFLAEGMDPDEDAATKHAASLREAFVRHMGDDIVEASRLKWPR
jgi:hypothetical protein